MDNYYYYYFVRKMNIFFLMWLVSQYLNVVEMEKKNV